MDWVLFAQAQEAADKIARGATEGGAIWLLSAALVVVAVVAVALYTRGNAKDAEIRAKDKEIAELIKSYGAQIAQLERAHGEKVEKMLSSWSSVTDNILRSLDRLSDAMERPIVKG